jgi:hypothetical protein
MLIGTAFEKIAVDVLTEKVEQDRCEKDIFCSGTEDVFVFFVCIG